MVSTTRWTSCATLFSLSGEPIRPWKYLLATILVAVCDHSAGTSTSRCSKMTEPLSLPMVAVRSSQLIKSYGVLPASSFAVKKRGNDTPVRSSLRRETSGIFLLVGGVMVSWPMAALVEGNSLPDGSKFRFDYASGAPPYQGLSVPI